MASCERPFLVFELVFCFFGTDISLNAKINMKKFRIFLIFIFIDFVNRIYILAGWVESVNRWEGMWLFLLVEWCVEVFFDFVFWCAKIFVMKKVYKRNYKFREGGVMIRGCGFVFYEC